MEWSNDLIIEFLELYEKESVIWNPSNEKHKDRYEIHDAWKRIESELGGKYSILELKKKRDSLMATYRKLSCKVKSSKKTGDVFKPEWFAYKKMRKFLRTVYNPRNRDASNSDTMEKEDSSSEESDDESEKNNEDITIYDNNLCSGEIVDPLASPCHSFSLENDSCDSSLRKKRKLQTKTIEMEKSMDKPYNFLKDPTEQPDKNECTLYMQLLAKKLRALDENTRERAMFEINILMYQLKQSSTRYHNTQEESFLTPDTIIETVSSEEPLIQNKQIKNESQSSPSRSNTSEMNQKSNVDPLPSIEETICDVTNKTDEWECFGQFVGQEIKTLKNNSNKKKLKRDIVRVIMKYQEMEDSED